jgi:hypothetical protein
LIKYPVRVVCFDNDPEAKRRARRLVEQITPFPGETYYVELDSKDPDSATERELTKLRSFLK